ncbi:response regulator [Nocardia terpenica]|uniref:Transcriptional regulatory protein n=1 Tax=Nocardia terpenica TaxID=455432 RepID=A0A164MVU4_9NOCA|nr:response regulator [Nocardia terpenica]KZM73711.1 response regulator receiver protein [Nocardia terpenica]MBF6064425.1 response regulator [Nocardia terpenica]MBF6106951.1 response regulator [Nocardia terpenica]MBF6114393.1 response regulator [Nocardia terpenica]MBF6121521.1 response regulator [Nocardia terpenica]
MDAPDLSVLVVDDDFRVANLHAGIVSALPGFAVGATVNTLAAARTAITGSAFDLALVDVYLPDGSGIDLVREISFDAMMLTAATEADTVRSALSAGALGYLVKPFDHAALAARLAGYARYRRILSVPVVTARDVDTAVEALRPVGPATVSAATASPTKDLVLQAVRDSPSSLSAAEVSAVTGVSRATAQRYLANLVAAGSLRMQLRYGSTGRPEQEYSAARSEGRQR